ncbi:hypothetical protein F5883DRAFT_511876 [Diaporthe sp. PMI_573]|nr:hypothetical protein F5883DRAFT_511876 [Diaporthaceae sp. PMI_573]
MGLWSQRYALTHPNALVMGTEPASLPPPPRHSPNCCFARYDFANEAIEFTNSPFDFIRGARLDGRVKNWPGFLNRAWRSLKPGGFIELHDISRHYVPTGADHPWADVPRLFATCGQKIERSFGLTASGQLRAIMGAVGFVNVTESWKRIPIGGPENMGHEILETLLDEIDGLVRIAMHGSFNEYAHLAYMERLRRSSCSLTLTCVRIWAQKPSEART